MIVVCADDVYDDEPFIFGDLLIEMIAATKQESHIQIVPNPYTNPNQTEEKQM